MLRLGALVAAVATGLLPSHVEPQISEAPAGSRTTFSFLVEHGCDGSPTTRVSIQVPDGAFDVVPVAPEGWTAMVEDTVPPVVTFTGGPLPDEVEGAFGFELVTPNRPGEDVFFPTVQTCEAGEIGWVDTTEGAEEPAPRIRLTENPTPILPTTTSIPAATDTTGTTLAAITSVPDDIDDVDAGSDPPLALIASLAAVAGAGVAAAARRRAR